MDGLYQSHIKSMPARHGHKHSLSDKFCFASRVCIYLYSLIYFLYLVLGISERYNFYTRMAIVLFGVIGIFIEDNGCFKIRKYLKFPQFSYWYAGILFLSFFSSLYTPSADSSAYTSNIFNTLVIGTVFISTLKNNIDVLKFVRGFSYCGGIVFFVLMAKNMLYIDDRLGRTLTSGNLNNFALYIMLTLSSSIAILYIDKKKFNKIVALVLSVLQVYMLMLSGGRKYIIFPVLLTVLLVLFDAKDKKTLFKKIGLMVAIALLCVIGWDFMMTNPIVYQSIGRRFVNGEALSTREDLIKYGWQLFLNRPIFGYGENSYTSIIRPYLSLSLYSHNNYIELLVNYGLIGFIWYYWFYIACIFKLYITSRKNRSKVAVFFCAFLLAGLFLQTGIVAYSTSSLLTLFIALAGKIIIIEKPLTS